MPRPKLTLLLSGPDDMDPRVSAALAAVDRFDPGAGVVLREAIADLIADREALEGRRIDTHLARTLSKSVSEVAGMSANLSETARSQQALYPRLDRALDLDNMDQTRDLQVAEQQHKERMALLAAEGERARLAARVAQARFKAMVGFVPVLLALTSFLTWWLSGGQVGGQPPTAPTVPVIDTPDPE